MAGWLFFLAWSCYATILAFSELPLVRRWLAVSSWAFIAIGSVFSTPQMSKVVMPLVGFGAAGLIHSLRGRYPSVPPRARTLSLVVFLAVLVAAIADIDRLAKIRGLQFVVSIDGFFIFSSRGFFL